MEYSKYLELVEKFFSKAGTVLKFKGKDYPDIGTSPSYLLLDEERGTYYLLEIVMPPDIPSLPQDDSETVNSYAAKYGINPFIATVAAVLGRDVNTGNLHIIDPSVDKKLSQKLALVVPYDLTDDFTGFFKARKLEYQAVPMKGVFCIFFFNSKAMTVFENEYKKLFPIGTTAKITPNNPVKPLSETPEADTLDYEAAYDEADEDDLPESDSQDYYDITDDDTTQSLFNEVEPNENQYSEILITNDTPTGFIYTSGENTADGHDNEHQSAETTTPPELGLFGLNNKFDSGTNIASSTMNSDTEYTLSPKNEQKGKDSSLAVVFRHIWSFIIFAPLYLFKLFTKDRVPKFILYWLGGMCVLLGMYYFPLSIAFGRLEDIITAASLNILSGISGLWFEFDISAIDYLGEVPFAMQGFMSELFSSAIAAVSINNMVIRFLNSTYFLQIALASGYFIAMVPAWRAFGKRVIIFMAVFYLLYFPSILIGDSAIKLIIMNQSAQTSIDTTLLASTGSIGGIIVASVLIPVIVIITALKASRSNVDVI